MPVNVDEIPHAGENAQSLSTRLAMEKARLASEQSADLSIVVAADTVVAHKDQILGKPADTEQARKILIDLRGRQHDVYTTLALIETRSSHEVVDLCKTSVPMRSYELEEMETYIATGDPMDKAGAYAIQDPSFRPVDIALLEGCYANVMGLPLCHLTRSMRVFESSPPKDVPQTCQSFTGYPCPVYAQILGDPS
jgi:MAF protein